MCGPKGIHIYTLIVIVLAVHKESFCPLAGFNSIQLAIIPFTEWYEMTPAIPNSWLNYVTLEGDDEK